MACTRFTPGTGVEADCITDNLTGLMWPRDTNLTPMTWDEAIDYAVNLSLCGHNGWSLADINGDSHAGWVGTRSGRRSVDVCLERTVRHRVHSQRHVRLSARREHDDSDRHR